jgi:hypothetical protein
MAHPVNYQPILDAGANGTLLLAPRAGTPGVAIIAPDGIGSVSAPGAVPADATAAQDYVTQLELYEADPSGWQPPDPDLNNQGEGNG